VTPQAPYYRYSGLRHPHRGHIRGVVRVLARAGYAGVLSVECDTLEQARRSLSYMSRLLEETS